MMLKDPLTPFTWLIALLLFGACQSAPPASDISLPILFSDHMVLQRDEAIQIWGTASPGGKIDVLFQDLKAETIAGEDGTWRVQLAPKPAGGPYTLRIVGQDTTVIEDVLVGDVWLGSGQSNMQWSVAQSGNPEAEIAAAQYPQIRLFSVERTVAARPRTNIPSDGWHLTTPESVENFSAVAYYFGRSLHDSLQVPVGLIHSSWGGTVAEAWTSTETLRELPDFLPAIEKLEEIAAGVAADEDPFEAMASSWESAIEAKDPGIVDGQPVWSAPDVDRSAWKTMSVPTLWEEEYLPGFDGFVWFSKSIQLAEAWTDADVTLRLGKIDDNDITWFNGVEVGRTSNYNRNRAYTVPASALHAGTNTIVVRVLDTGGGGGLWGEAADMGLERTGSAERIRLDGDWLYEPATALNDPDLPIRPSAQQNTPTALYNAMIYPLIPYSIKGVIWYQGESNAGRAYQYRTLFPALISDWRKKWNASFSFLFVQLANFRSLQENPSEDQTWPELREAQTMTLDVPNTGMAVIIDIGEADDIHPKNKQDVGARLARAALNKSYGQDVVAGGPLFNSLHIEGRRATLTFDQVGGGLTMMHNESPNGFAIAGEDRVFHWAEAEIVGENVVVSSAEVSEPVAVRYGWADNPRISLYNAEGVPASPFRTDDWPGVTMENR